MKADILKQLRDVGPSGLSLTQIAAVLGQARSSARVFCSRAVQRGELVRVRRDLYLLPEVWRSSGEEDRFRLANFIQTPSYVSLLTALSFYGFTTQIPQEICESVSPIRRAVYAVEGFRFAYFLLKPSCYCGFERRDDIFIARPEKALCDSLHLASFGSYAFDADAIDRERFDRKELQRAVEPFPQRTRRALTRFLEGG